MPRATLAGTSPAPGHLGRTGPVTAARARALAGCAASDPATAWRAIITDPAGLGQLPACASVVSLMRPVREYRPGRQLRLNAAFPVQLLHAKHVSQHGRLAGLVQRVWAQLIVELIVGTARRRCLVTHSRISPPRASGRGPGTCPVLAQWAELCMELNGAANLSARRVVQ